MEWMRSISWGIAVILLLIVLLYLFYVAQHNKRAKALNQSGATVFPKLFLRFFYMALIVVAYLGPLWGKSSLELSVEGKDLVFAIDLSNSMNGGDIVPSRLGKVKSEVNKMIKQFESDRLGLIMFSSEAYWQCPLTFDHSIFKLFLDALQTSNIATGGTDFAGPLAIAYDKMMVQKDSISTKELRAKILILISDGEDFGDETSIMLQQIKEEGIQLYTVGVGTEAGSQVPGPRGRALRYTDGSAVISKLNREALQQLASEGGGQYFEISDQVNQSQDLVDELKSLEGSQEFFKKQDASRNLYFPFLIIAVLLFIVDMVWVQPLLKL